MCSETSCDAKLCERTMSVMAKVKTPCEQPVMRTSVGTKFERNAEAMTKTKFVMRVKTSRHATVISVPTCAGGKKSERLPRKHHRAAARARRARQKVRPTSISNCLLARKIMRTLKRSSSSLRRAARVNGVGKSGEAVHLLYGECRPVAHMLAVAADGLAKTSAALVRMGRSRDAKSGSA
jgi:hypothetical protein